MKKKIFLVITLCLLIFPSTIKAETCDSSNIKLELISASKIEGNAEEINEASINNNKIILNIKMYDPGDLIEYNVKVKNITNEDYYFDENSLKLNTDYLEYEFVYENNSNIIEAGKEKNIKLRIEYKTKVPTNELINDSFNNTNTMTINIFNKETTNIASIIKNPETGRMTILYLFLLLTLSGLSLVVVKRKKKARYMVIIFGVLIIVPMTINAICKCNIEIEAKIEIDGKEAYFLTGEEVNVKMKQLAGNDTSLVEKPYNTINTNITSIKYSKNEPGETNKQDINIVSTSDSPYPIYMWYDNGTIYWWSEDKSPNVNEDASFMFKYLTSLVDMSGLENFDLTNTKIMQFTFASSNTNNPMTFTSLEYLSKWNVSNVEDMTKMFEINRSITKLDGLENWDVSNVKSFSYLFNYNDKLVNIDAIKSWDVSKVEDMSGLFIDAASLTNLDALKSWNTKNVTNLKSTFRDDVSLKSLDGLKNWNVSKVQDVNMFCLSCTSLEDASSINDWDISNVTNFKYMFRYSPVHPEFTKITGTWSDKGTFIPN